MKAYNQKIIETPTYLEIYDYEAIITPKQKADKNENNPKQKIELDWLYEEENPTTDKRKKYDKLSAQGQHDSLKRKQKYYQNMRFEIARLVDMNFEKSALSVKQTLATCDKWEIKFQVSKAKKSLQTISIDSETLQVIKRWQLKQKEYFLKMGIKPAKNGEQLLFVSEENKPLYLDYVNHNLKIIIKENNLKRITPHGFRHTHCSLLFESGASLKEVQVRLGHTDIKTTMDIYTHVTKRQTEETANRFADFMSSTEEKQGNLQRVKSMVKTQKSRFHL